MTPLCHACGDPLTEWRHLDRVDVGKGPVKNQQHMVCPGCGGYATDRWRCDGVEVAVVCNYCNGGAAVPIPEGTRVEVGWWDVPDDRTEPMDWYPVATATVGEVLAPLYDDDFWIVVLTDVEVTDG